MQTAALKGSPLSAQQARLWSLSRNNPVYRVTCALHLQGRLNKSALQNVLQRLVACHEILRTVFYLMPGMDIPVQVVTDDAALRMRVMDLDELSPQRQTALVEHLMASLQNETCDLAQPPLLQVWLLQLSSHTHLLLLSLPALCADAGALRVCVEEIQRGYALSLQQDEWPDEEDLLQYADVAAWQEDILVAEDAEAHRRYWRDIDGAWHATLHVPFARAQERIKTGMGAQKGFKPEVLSVPLDENLLWQAQELAARYHVSNASLWLACWQIALWRLSGEVKFLIGVACEGRIFEELSNALGPYTRFVPLEASFARERSFTQTLTAVDASLQEANKQQMYFTWEGSERDGEEKMAPFFPVSFEYDVWPAEFHVGDLSIAPVHCRHCIDRFMLKMHILQIGERLQPEIHFDPTILTAEQVERLALVTGTLFRALVTQPQLSVSQLPLLPQTEQTLLRTALSGAQSTLPARGLHHYFEEQARRYPEQLAVLSASERLTYQELNSKANQLACVLRKRGVGANVLVGLCTQRSALMIVGLLAILKAGGAYVPFDPESPSERLAYQLTDVQPLIVLTQQAQLSRLPGTDAEVLCLEEILQEAEQEATENLAAVVDLEDLAYVMYTSGSTGVPKGVQIRQRSVVNYALAIGELLGNESGLQFATVSTLAADLGNTAIFGALTSGGCLHILDYETITSGEAFTHWQQEHPIDVLKIVPSHLSALLHSAGSEMLLPRQALILGGEALPYSLIEQLRRLGAPCRIYNHYGPTETTIGVIVNESGQLQSSADQLQEPMQQSSVPLGLPIANTEAYVLDQALHMVPVDVAGELYLGGAGLARGYLHQPEQTAERFIPHPFSTESGARLYRTGDLVRYTEEGQIVFLGRRDSQVKLRGYRIELGEIEAVIRRHANVRDCAVMLREDLADEPRLVGYIVPQRQPAPDTEDIRTFVRKFVPEYMVPLTCVFLDALPLTANGKMDRRQLPLPEQIQNSGQRMFVAPRTSLEEILLDIWKDLLDAPMIGVHDNFFQSGGHSLLATQVISRVRSILHAEISILSLFEAPTIAGLAQHIAQKLLDEQQANAPVALMPVPRTQDLPLSFAQQRLWFLDQLEPGSVAYLLPRSLRMHGALHVAALEQSLQALVERHESLRTTFHAQVGQPVQVIHPSVRILLPIIDLQGLAGEAREQEARRLAEQEANSPCHLEYGPLMRVRLLRLATAEHIVLLTMHHIISDGWSNDVFVRELAALYQACKSGLPSPLPPLSVQYADFASWQRQWLQGDVLDEKIHYWTEQLRDLAPLDLPTDHLRPVVQSFRGAYESTLLPVDLYERLKSFSQDADVTLFMTLLATFQLLLMRYSGQADITVGTPIANRTRQELEELIGFFVNTLVLRTDLSGNPTFLELLHRVREVVLSAYLHQDVPFEKIVEVLRPERDLSRSPLFQVMFIWQNVPRPTQTFEQITMSPLELVNVSSKFDLTFFIEHVDAGLLCNVEYSTDLFEPNTIQRMLGHWQTLLEEML
ncbi:MAG TPA: amino acid adenylation domain-containing protein, partial [Ktedonobacteraceae bacterium]|nr:amino acid adenylation domain-containing protein [Ktedonobacteraceae bacterium]